MSILKYILAPLASRKVRVALATIVAAYLVKYIPNVSEDVVYTVISVGVAVVLGIAIEDNGAKANQFTAQMMMQARAQRAIQAAQQADNPKLRITTPSEQD